MGLLNYWLFAPPDWASRLQGGRLDSSLVWINHKFMVLQILDKDVEEHGLLKIIYQQV